MKDILAVLKATWPEWEIVEKLGSGSYGEVYKARRQDLVGVTFAAIKTCVIPKDPQDLKERRAEHMSEQEIASFYLGIVKDYTAEIRLMDAVKGCANTVAIDDYRVVQDSDEPFWYILIRMELLTPLMEVLGKQKMSEEEIVKLGADISTALNICAKNNIVHRDIKPDNIFVNKYGNYKLGDFGVARRLEHSTLHFSRQGTPYYMAPEIYTSSAGSVDFSAACKVDIYSLGMVLYWLANGNRHPFMPMDHSMDSPALRTESLMRRIKGEPLPPPVNVSKQLQAVILKACAYKPEDRFSSADEMRIALTQSLNGDTPIPTPLIQTPPARVNPDFEKCKGNANIDADLTLLMHDSSPEKSESNVLDEIDLTLPNQNFVPEKSKNDIQVSSNNVISVSNHSIKKQENNTALKTVVFLAVLVAISSLVFIGLHLKNDFTYTIHDGKATITKYTGNGGEVVIPNTLGGYPVGVIDNNVFYNQSSVTSIIIPSSVTSIGDYAFFGCNSLTSVAIPNSVTSIGYHTFHGCNALTNVMIPNSVTFIGNYAFSGCSGLISVIIPSGVSSIGSNVFSDCSGLISVTIPNSVTSIENAAFYRCSSLTSLTIPDSVSSIENYAFSGCSSLTSVTIPNSVSSIEYYAFSGCSSVTRVTIPNSVTSISSNVFSGCSALISVTIPDSVISIENYAFSGCSRLTSLTIPDSVTFIGKNAFSGCSESLIISVAKNSYAQQYCKENKIKYTNNDASQSSDIQSGIEFNYEIKGGKAIITKYTGFDGDVVIPDTLGEYTVEEIAMDAFRDCVDIISVVIPDGVKTIGANAFYQCKNLTSVTIPASVISIGANAFYRCNQSLVFTVSKNSYALDYCQTKNKAYIIR